MFNKTLIQRIATMTFDGTQTLYRTGGAPYNIYYRSYDCVLTNNTQEMAAIGAYCDHFVYYGAYMPRADPNNNTKGGLTIGGDGSRYTTFCFDCRTICDPTSIEDFSAWLVQNPTIVQFPLSTPITYDLGTVELPILPNPLTVWADGGSAQPTISMSYEQDINIVIGELRAAISDMATS